MKHFYLPALSITLLVLFACNNTPKHQNLNKYYFFENGKVFFQDINPMRENQKIELKQANPDFFRLIEDQAGRIPKSESYMAADNMNVYFKDMVLQGADPKNITILKDGFSKDAQKVFFKNINLPGADAGSFKILGNLYAKDENTLWFGSKAVPDTVDLNSFAVIDGYFSKDKNRVYFNQNHRLIPVNDCSPKDFSKSKLNDDEADYIVYQTKDEIWLLNKNSQNITADNLIKLNARPESFTLIGRGYAKDSSRVFYQTDPMTQAQAESFRICLTDSTDAEDDLHIYAKGKIIAPKNPKN